MHDHFLDEIYDVLSKNYFLLNYNVLDLEFYWKDWYIIASIKQIANSWVFISHRTLSCNKQISVQPHRWQPTRLPHPWDSPGKNTGVGCHFLLQCMKVKSESEVSRSVVSDPQRPHGLQPTRLLHPWDFPGKSTGVGCHCLLWLHSLICHYYCGHCSGENSTCILYIQLENAVWTEWSW